MASFLPTRRSGYFEINQSVPEFLVHYVGKSESARRPGRRSCDELTAAMCQVASGDGKKMAKVRLKIASRGVTVSEKVALWRRRETFHQVSDIIYGAASKRAPGAFSFVLGKEIVNRKPRSYETHVFMCPDSTTAKMLTLYLIKAFEVAFQEYLRHKQGHAHSHRPTAHGHGPKAAAAGSSQSNGSTLDQLLTELIQSGSGEGAAKDGQHHPMKEQFRKFEEREREGATLGLTSDLNATELDDPELKEALEEVVGTLRAKSKNNSDRPTVLPNP